MAAFDAEAPDEARAVVPEEVPAERGRLPARTANEWVDAQQLAQPLARILGTVLRISCGAPVAHPDVEEAVAVELQLSPVVVRVRLIDEQQLTGARQNRAAVAGAELDDAGIAVSIGVVDVEPVIAPVVRMKRDGQQTLLPSARHAVADVEERASRPPVDEVDDAADLLDGIEASRLSGSRGDRRQRIEPARERAHRELLLRLRCRNQKSGDGEQRSDHQLKLPTTP